MRLPAQPTHLPGPDVDDHVVLVAHGDNVLGARGKGHASHTILMLLQLCHLATLSHVPNPHCWHVPTLQGGRTGSEGQKHRDPTNLSKWGASPPQLLDTISLMTFCQESRAECYTRQRQRGNNKCLRTTVSIREKMAPDYVKYLQVKVYISLFLFKAP